MLRRLWTNPTYAEEQGSLWWSRMPSVTSSTPIHVAQGTHQHGCPNMKRPQLSEALSPLGTTVPTDTCPCCLVLPSFPEPGLLTLAMFSTLWSISQNKRECFQGNQQTSWHTSLTLRDFLPKTKFKFVVFVGNILSGKGLLGFFTGLQISQSRENKDHLPGSGPYANYDYDNAHLEDGKSSDICPVGSLTLPKSPR